MTRFLLLALPVRAAALAAATLLSACSSHMGYDAAQAWQRDQCFKIINSQERSRCLASSSQSYEQYRREAAAARDGEASEPRKAP